MFTLQYYFVLTTSFLRNHHSSFPGGPHLILVPADAQDRFLKQFQATLDAEWFITADVLLANSLIHHIVNAWTNPLGIGDHIVPTIAEHLVFVNKTLDMWEAHVAKRRAAGETPAHFVWRTATQVWPFPSPYVPQFVV